MTLKALLVEDLDSDRKRFEANPYILVNVTFVDGSETTLSKNVVRTEALGNSLQLVQSEGNDVGIEQRIFSRVLKVAQI